MGPVALAMSIGLVTVIRAALRCAEILVRAYADNLRERTRRETTLAVMRLSGGRAPELCESMAVEHAEPAVAQHSAQQFAAE
jgi:hypothetical protein